MIGPLVFCILVFSIYKQIQRQPNWLDSFQRIRQAFDTTALWKLIVVIALMFLNWAIEARKWQVAIGRIQRLSFLTAFKAIFTGTTFAFFTPNRMGEYLGRVWCIEHGKRIQSISLTIVCSMAQLLITLIAGISGLYYVKVFIAQAGTDSESIIFWLNMVWYCSIAGTVLLALLYFRLSWLIRWIEKIPRIEKYLSYIRVLDNFNATILLRILSLSIGRYIVFMIQYYLLFQVFDVGINWWETFWSMSVVFLILAIIPSIAILTELGIRWKASIELVQLFSVHTLGILATSLAVWIINLVIPALIGSLLILGIRFFRYNNK